MMAFEDKKKKAIALMEDKKMWRSNYAPPILRLFWKMGGKMPPPPFAPFWLNTLFFAVWFGPLWGIVMWFSSWKNQDFSVLLAVFTALLPVCCLVYSWRLSTLGANGPTNCLTGRVSDRVMR